MVPEFKFRVRILLPVLAGEIAIARATAAEPGTEDSMGKCSQQFMEAGRADRVSGGSWHPSSPEEQLTAQDEGQSCLAVQDSLHAVLPDGRYARTAPGRLSFSRRHG